MSTNLWPEIDFATWKDTLATVHLWAQIVGKIRLKAMPWLNHSWHVTLHVTSKGLSTGSMPYDKGIFEMEFNFLEHVLIITTSEGAKYEIELYNRTVSDFYATVLEHIKQAGIDITIYAKPNELEIAITLLQGLLTCAQHRTIESIRPFHYYKKLLWAQ